MVLLTGATGFLGQHLAESLLADGEQLRILARRPQTVPGRWLETGAEVVEGDLLDTAALLEAAQGCRAAVHAAAKVSFRRKDWPKMRRINPEGTANVVNALLETGAQRLVLVSSVAALSRKTPGETLDENTPWRNSRFNSVYGRTKYLSELEAYRGHEEGLEVAMVNPGIILGPAASWDRSSPQLVEKAAQGLRWAPAGVNGFVGVQDVVDMIRRLLTHPLEQPRRYLAISENLPYAEVFRQLALALGVRPPTRTLPPLAAETLGRVFDSLLPGSPLSLETFRNTSYPFYYSNERARRELDLQFTPMQQVLEATAESYRQQAAHST